MFNIEKSGFHKGEYVGYGNGTVYKISRGDKGWFAMPRDPLLPFKWAKTLRELSKAIS